MTLRSFLGAVADAAGTSLDPGRSLSALEIPDHIRTRAVALSTAHKVTLEPDSRYAAVAVGDLSVHARCHLWSPMPRTHVAGELARVLLEWDDIYASGQLVPDFDGLSVSSLTDLARRVRVHGRRTHPVTVLTDTAVHRLNAGAYGSDPAAPSTRVEETLRTLIADELTQDTFWAPDVTTAARIALEHVDLITTARALAAVDRAVTVTQPSVLPAEGRQR